VIITPIELIWHEHCCNLVHVRRDLTVSQGRGAAWNRKRGAKMSDRNTQTENDTFKEPTEWTTGDEPMTEAQESYVHTLARKAGETVPVEMTKAEASLKIDELRKKTGVGDAPPKKPKARSSE
jgi:Protein of unknown function (DUF3072)